jgi:hypothetical protein
MVVDANTVAPMPKAENNGAPTDSGGDDTPKRKSFTEQLLNVSDLSRLPPVEPLVDKVLYRNTVAQLSGPPGSYKSFIAVALACALASKQGNWEGHRIPKRVHVVYVATEGATGLRARILAWCEQHGVDPAELEGWLFVLPVAVQLGAPVDVCDAVEMVRNVGAGLLVLDTRARCTLGLEENSATEQGRAVDASDRIRQAAGCTVWVIHHSGRAGATPRGSTAWDGAVWTDLRLKSEERTVQITVEKHKDVPSGQTYEYRLIPRTVSEALMPGVDEENRKSLVVFSNTDENRGKILTEILKRVGKIAENSCGLEGLPRTKIVALAVAAGIPESSAYRAINALIARSFLQNVGTEKRPRYAYIGATLGGDDDTAV